MFFRKFNFNIYYISFYRLFFFFTLFYSIIIDSSSNLFLCSFLLNLVNTLNLKLFLFNLLNCITALLVVKFISTKKRNIINYILIDIYLLLSFLLGNLNKYLTFLNTTYIFMFYSNLAYYTINTVLYNSRAFYLYFFILKNLVKLNYNWYPLYKKLSYYGYFRSSRFNNVNDYERSILFIKS